MLRREFLATLCASGVAQALPSSAGLGHPATLDLRVPLRLAMSCISNRMDPEAGYRPWFAVDTQDWKLRHDTWDCGDMSGRFLEGLILGRNMIEPTPEMLQSEQRIRKYLISLLNADGLVTLPGKNQVDHMFSQGSTLYGMVTDFQAGKDPAMKAHIQTLIAALNQRARHEEDYVWFPEVATPIAPCSHMAAYQVLPVVRFYELTGDPAALKYAEGLSRWAFYHDPTMTEEGVITKTGWEGHLHAWMDTYSGILRCSRAGGNLDRSQVLTRSCNLYEWVKQNYTTPYGWVADSVGSQTCETCTISSAIRLALELIKEGHTEYWNDVERFVRNQVIANQFHHTDQLGIQNPATVRGLLGAFESYADPNTLIAVKDETIEGCCINGGIRCLFLAYQNAIHATDDTVQINLLLTHGTPDIDVVSYLPDQGRMELYPRSSKTISFRCPEWLRPEAVSIGGPAGLRQSINEKTNFLQIAGVKPGARIALSFAQPDKTVTSIVAGKTYEVTWRGDTVQQLWPPGKPYPTYQKAILSRPSASFASGRGAFKQPSVVW